MLFFDKSSFMGFTGDVSSFWGKKNKNKEQTQAIEHKFQ